MKFWSEMKSSCHVVHFGNQKYDLNMVERILKRKLDHVQKRGKMAEARLSERSSRTEKRHKTDRVERTDKIDKRRPETEEHKIPKGRSSKSSKDVQETPKESRETRDTREIRDRETKDTKEARENGKREIYYAPEEAVEVITSYIKDLHTVWDPACGPSEAYPLKDVLERNGHRVVCSDLLLGSEFDFFTYKTKKRFDIIVTTPPYSFRKDFILRALDLKKPFAFLVPMNVLESKTLRDVFMQEKVSVIYPPKTISFISLDNNRSVKALPYSVWVMWGIPNIPPIVYL